MGTADSGSFNLGTRLTFTFVILIILILGGYALVVWQFQITHNEADRLAGANQQLNAVLRLQASLLSYHRRLEDLARSMDVRRFQTEAESVRGSLRQQTQQTRTAIASLPSGTIVDPSFLPTLDIIDITLSAQIDAMVELAKSGDWGAIQPRVDKELNPIETQTAILVNSINQQASEELERGVAKMRSVQRRILIIVPATALSTFFIAAFFGWSISRRIHELQMEEQAKIRRLEADLAHIDRVSTLGEMAASLAHEIKQPIAATITSANSCMEWLAHEPPNLDRARAAVARIDKYGNRAAEIIDRIKSFYRKSPSQRELVDVNGVIQEVLTLLKCEADQYSIAMRTELAAELPKIIADRVQLQQVFMNLMLNGIEAMTDSGGELTVRSQCHDSQLLFSVSDTGVGLPTEKVEQIFSAFFTTKPQGSGMGLAICRSIIESHGGRLWATANDERGATFHFTLPVQTTETSNQVHLVKLERGR